LPIFNKFKKFVTPKNRIKEKKSFFFLKTKNVNRWR